MLPLLPIRLLLKLLLTSSPVACCALWAVSKTFPNGPWLEKGDEGLDPSGGGLGSGEAGLDFCFRLALS